VQIDRRVGGVKSPCVGASVHVGASYHGRCVPDGS
jgi:hypothetical protein